MNFEAELADIVLARLNNHEAETIERLKAMGYKITKARAPKAKTDKPLGLNAVGKPYSPLFNPNYKVKHKIIPAYMHNKRRSDRETLSMFRQWQKDNGREVNA